MDAPACMFHGLHNLRICFLFELVNLKVDIVIVCIAYVNKSICMTKMSQYFKSKLCQVHTAQFSKSSDYCCFHTARLSGVV